MSPIKFKKTLQEFLESKKTELPYKLGKIDSLYTTGRPKIVFDDNSQSTKEYPYLSHYTPTANDRVLLARVADSYVVIGKIV